MEGYFFLLFEFIRIYFHLLIVLPHKYPEVVFSLRVFRGAVFLYIANV